MDKPGLQKAVSILNNMISCCNQQDNAGVLNLANNDMSALFASNGAATGAFESNYSDGLGYAAADWRAAKSSFTAALNAVNSQLNGQPVVAAAKPVNKRLGR